MEEVFELFDMLDRLDDGVVRRPRIIRERIDNFSNLDEEDFFRRYRMTKATALFVLELIETDLEFDSVSSIFSPRMDFEQWKPLTGRGDPLRNDPTYDYEPPVLDRVHYWADEPRPEREHRPERKSEVLMLGVSSRKPSIIPRQPPKRHHRPTANSLFRGYCNIFFSMHPLNISEKSENNGFFYVKM